jgi:serine/threonine protein kinase
MSLVAGTRLGPYEIQSLLGAGGMGEVYRARDTRLDRSVAVKVLPQQFARDAAMKQRFDREARTISTLNHPNICHLYDVGSHDGIDFLVMELLDGESLADRLSKGPLPAETMLKTAMEIADALERAHRAGIVHRDLKPGNIMLTRTGAKLLDFGLAKPAAGRSFLDPQTPADATRTSPLTARGSLIGTFQYMSPEQIEGKEADARSDLFSFGAVLYEMATGHRAFTGSTPASVIAAVLSSQPKPIVELQPLTPPAVDRLVGTCLQKDPELRWQSAYDVKLHLGAIRDFGVAAASPAAQAPSLRRWIAGLVAAVLIIASGFSWWLWRSPAPPAQVHSSLLPPQSQQFNPDDFALSPDGSMIAYTTEGQRGGLWLRRLTTGKDEQLTGTESASFPFWSPDSRSIGFFGNAVIRRIDLGGGPAVTVVEAPGLRGASWGADGTIVFSPDFGKSGLRRVSAQGGPVTVVSRVQSARGEDTHRWPFLLPDGRHLVFFMSSSHSLYGSDPNDTVAGIYLLDLKTGATKFLVHSDSGAKVANGYLFYALQQNLVAQKLSPDGRILGSPQPIAEQVQYDANHWLAGFSVSDRLLAWTNAPGITSRLAWFNRDGKEIGTVDVKGSPSVVSLSPDGTKVATSVGQPSGDTEVWVYDLVRGGETRLTFGNGVAFDPIWTRDGQAVTYILAERGRSAGNNEIVSKPSTGLGAESVVIAHAYRVAPNSWSPDGRHLLYMNFAGGKGPRLWVHDIGPNPGDHPLFQADLNVGEARFSPDGKWIAYASSENGHYEIYVIPYPSLSTRYSISNVEAAQSVWARDGRQLYFIAADGRLMSVSVAENADGLQIGPPRALFQTNITQAFEAYTQFDVSPDGSRFLINTRVEHERQPIQILDNWISELKK